MLQNLIFKVYSLRNNRTKGLYLLEERFLFDLRIKIKNEKVLALILNLENNHKIEVDQRI